MNKNKLERFDSDGRAIDIRFDRHALFILDSSLLSSIAGGDGLVSAPVPLVGVVNAVCIDLIFEGNPKKGVANGICWPPSPNTVNGYCDFYGYPQGTSTNAHCKEGSGTNALCINNYNCGNNITC